MDNEELASDWREWKRGRIYVQLLPGDRSIGAWMMFNNIGYVFLLAIDLWWWAIRIGAL